jgi:hypothetical protein
MGDRFAPSSQNIDGKVVIKKGPGFTKNKDLFLHEKSHLDFSLLMKEVSAEEYQRVLKYLMEMFGCDSQGNPV